MKPNEIEDEFFGKLIWEQNGHFWAGHSKMDDGTPFVLMIRTMSDLFDIPSNDDELTWDRTIGSESRKTLTLVQRSDLPFRDAVAREYLRDYRQWSQDPNYDAATFMRRLKLESVTLFSGGGAEISFGDDDMFGGHALIVHMKPDGWLSRVEMFG